MKKIKVMVSAYVSTVQEVEVRDDFDVNDDNDLAHLDQIQNGLRGNVEDCLRENAEVVMISDAETDECYYKQ